MAKLYERFLKILQNWPLHLDYPLPLRSLAQHIREEGKVAFSARGDLVGKSQNCERHLKSLERISRGHWFKKYPSNRLTGSLGLTAEQCRFGLSEEYQQALNSSRIYSSFRTVISSVRKK